MWIINIYLVEPSVNGLACWFGAFGGLDSDGIPENERDYYILGCTPRIKPSSHTFNSTLYTLKTIWTASLKNSPCRSLHISTIKIDYNKYMSNQKVQSNQKNGFVCFIQATKIRQYK